MIRILHTIDTTGPGGAETVFVNLIKGLDRQKYEPIVAIRGTGWVCDELHTNGVDTLFIKSKGAFDINYLIELVRLIRSKRIKIIHSHLLGSNVYCSLAGIICGVPVVSTFHGFVDVHMKERFSLIKKFIVNFGSTSIVFVSDSLRKFYVEQKGFTNKKSVTVYNGVDCSLFRPQPDDSIRKKFNLAPDNILVGAVGNIRQSKGYEYLIEAAKLVFERYPHFRFVVAGEGIGSLFDGLLNLRRNMGLEDCFFFTGFEPDVSKFINNLNIFVLPSVSEGFSIATIESMACGVPIIATRCGGPEEIINHLENGLLVEACNSSELAEHIVKLYADTLLKNNLIFNGLKVAKSKFSSTDMIGNYSKIYDKLLRL